MDIEDAEKELTEEEIESQKNRVNGLVDIVLGSIGNQFGDDLSEEDLMDIFAARLKLLLITLETTLVSIPVTKARALLVGLVPSRKSFF